MTKGELRKLRKSGAVDFERSTSIEMSEDGSLEMVRQRTRKEEQRHKEGWDKWAKQVYDRD